MAARLERRWLFHGTDQGTVDKIIQQGFNRSFCGKNMTKYGKGVYFARDASYSSSPQYSVPNALGVQHMFLCRVVVGEYCKGVKDALTPAPRTGSQRRGAARAARRRRRRRRGGARAPPAASRRPERSPP